MARADLVVERVVEALRAGAILHCKSAHGSFTAGPYHAAVGGARWAVLGNAPARGDASTYHDSVYDAAAAVVERAGVGRAIDAVKAAAPKVGLRYVGLAQPLARASVVRRNPAAESKGATRWARVKSLASKGAAAGEHAYVRGMRFVALGPDPEKAKRRLPKVAGAVFGPEAVGVARRGLDTVDRLTRNPRRSNPLIRGYSSKAISRNIAREIDAGRPQAQAVAIAFATARAAWVEKHPHTPIPAWLKRA